MSDQTLVFGGVSPWQRPDRPFGEERKSARSLIAAVVAGGLALSASLYPSVGEVPIPGFLDLPKVARALGLPVLTGGLPTQRPMSPAQQADLAELLHLATIIARNPHLVPAEVLRALIQTPGFTDLLDRIGRDGTAPGGVDFGRNFFSGFVGGGGGGGGSMALPGTLAEWLFFLDVLLHRLPVRVLVQLSAALTRMVPEPVAVESVVQATALIQTVAVVLPPPETVPALPPAQSAAPVAPELVGPAPTLIVTLETPVVPVVMETSTPAPPPPVLDLVPEVVITPPPPVVIPVEVTPEPVLEIPPPEETVVDIPPVIDEGPGEEPTEVPPADWDDEPDETPSLPGDSGSTTGESDPGPHAPADDPGDGGGDNNASALRFSAIILPNDGSDSNSASAAPVSVLDMVITPTPAPGVVDIPPLIDDGLDEEPDGTPSLPGDSGSTTGESDAVPDVSADDGSDSNSASAAPVSVLDMVITPTPAPVDVPTEVIPDPVSLLELLITPTPAPVDVPTEVIPDPVIEIPLPEDTGVVDISPVVDDGLGEVPTEVLPAGWDAEPAKTPSLPGDSDSTTGESGPAPDVPAADDPGVDISPVVDDGLGEVPTEVLPADWDEEADETPSLPADFDSTTGESDPELDVPADGPDEGGDDGDDASASRFSASGSGSDDGPGSSSSSSGVAASSSDGDSSSGDSANE
ncbi:hypothetical protein ACQI4F_16590 [Mycolicibacterium vaccae]|uniref:hypothetical protein n=1 Tax=Mycolicibacterium vaccae TaxID=1810 RepID=UPI003CEC7F00